MVRLQFLQIQFIIQIRERNVNYNAYNRLHNLPHNQLNGSRVDSSLFTAEGWPYFQVLFESCKQMIESNWSSHLLR